MYMRKLFLPIFFFACSFQIARAQTPFINRDSLNINNINASILLHGDMWWDPTEQVAKCEFPSGSGKNIAFTSALWMGGYDEGGALHVASQTYRQTGNDYWPGPLYPTDTLTYATSNEWAKFWKVLRSDINTFLAIGTHTTSNTPASILNWPGKGNTYATGAGGVSLSIPTSMAPFVDLNGNGTYEPLLGEYPSFNGDEAIWWVFSDNGPTHSTSNAVPLGVEVHVLNYGYHRNTAIDNVVYYDYEVVNRSTHKYDNFRFAQWADMDLGYYMDDFIGFDSTHRMGIIYNGTNADGTGLTTDPNHYGTHIPVAAVSMVRMPGDAGTNYVPVGSFDYYNNDNSIIGNPQVDTEYNNYMRAKLKNGTHFTNDFQGPGVASKGYGLGPNSNYVFTGNPGNSTEWSECVCNNNPGDRRFIISSSDMTLDVGATLRITMALITTWPDSLNACPGITFDSIKTYADTAWSVFHNAIPASVQNSSLRSGGYNVYPNPASDWIEVNGPAAFTSEVVVTVCNTLGQKWSLPCTSNGMGVRIQTGILPPGCYHILSATGNVPLSFIKN